MNFLTRAPLVIAACLLLLPLAGLAQKKKDKRFKLFPFPVIYYSPETKFVFGAAGTATYRFPKDSLTSRPSAITAGIAYTQNKQILLYTNFQVFYDHAKWYAFGEAGYYIYNYYFYGVGEQQVPEELYGVDYPRIKLNVTRRILPHIYMGPSYQLEHYAIKDTAAGGALAQNLFPGSRGSRTSGLGLQMIYDSRDSVLYPYKGFFVNASFMNSGNNWGGDHNFNRYILDATYYGLLYPEIILAINSYNSFVTGDAPFQQLSLLGGNKKMRGYYEGRYIDRNLAVLQAEVRFPIYRRLGGVVLGDVGALGNAQHFLRTNDLKTSYGAGLRFNVIRKDHLNLRLDYAIGPGTSGIYFTVGEAF